MKTKNEKKNFKVGYFPKTIAKMHLFSLQKCGLLVILFHPRENKYFATDDKTILNHAFK